ncbi:PREDICTED: endonuclease domain-containing 1 protein-like [Nanorana parkeri]|uniref:endonuclease domain-containing 1 protein-like n=1 Tax=Nanorana parkeri TaxID=125878 RepID=UPI00085435B3|nr:PREDICTED: endonuclease domain-containing 1 protein-like [Nanorana parkeri]
MFLNLCWLLVAVAYQAEGRVDKDFTKCSQAFYNNTMPVGFEGIATPHDFKEIPDGITTISDLKSPAYICQTLGGNSYYATLYDRGRRIPLYSAYILDRNSIDPKPNCTRTSTFKLEPQLIYRNLTENMQSSKDTGQSIANYSKENIILLNISKNKPDNLMKASQAVDYDYGSKTDPNKPTTATKYTRGHLNPCGHHKEKENFLSTFTLTNVVPMVAELNNGEWSKYETEMISISAGCDKMYVVTGAVPGNNKLNDRVTIPSYVWNAYCCVDGFSEPIKSGGAIAANDKALITDNKFKVVKMELSDLQDELKKHLGISNNIEFEIFQQCKEWRTVGDHHEYSFPEE